MRAVLDTNVVISGLLWRGPQRRVLDAARDGILELFTSPTLLQELEEVLNREKFALRLAAANITGRELMDGYAALATVIEAAPIEPVIASDPDDDAVLACALAAEAEVIISGDGDLLDLNRFRGIRILKATDLLTELSL